MPFIYFYDPTILLLIPAIIIAAWAQMRISRDFSKYSGIPSERGIPSNTVAERMLRSNGISDVSIEYTQGSLSDHYDPRTNIIRLSSTVYGRSSIAAIAVAAHETGHAIQDAEGYFPLRLRNFLAPVVNIGSTLAFPLILIGFIFNFSVLLEAALIVFFAIFIFQLITLPVELNASRRALSVLAETGALYDDELVGAKRVLTSAALTYIAATITALIQFLRFFLLSRNRR